MQLNVVLVEPEIPQNTGNIVRTCAATGVKLHLVKPLGFLIDDKHLKRAGLDYWNEADISYYENFAELMDKNRGATFFYSTKKALKAYTDVVYPDGCFIVFGKETAGLPEDLIRENIDSCIRIPMRSNIRSLNLSNSVAIIVYEALRQNGFEGLEKAFV